MMDNTARKSGGFTGRHMLLCMLAFFGVVIGVNITMATLASKSWTGLVVGNSYVASQQFNERIAESKAQEALGWKSTLTIENGRIAYALVDADGKAVNAKGAHVKFRHPAYDAEDHEFDLTASGDGQLTSTREVRDGGWIIDIATDVGRDKPYREARRVLIKDGTGNELLRVRR